MDFFRTFRNRLRQLEQQQLIDLTWIQIWLVAVVTTFATMSWIWERLVVQNDPTSHFPPSLLPLNLRRKLPAHGFVTEKEARAFSIREIEVAVIACRRDGDVSDESAMDTVTMMKSAAMLSKSVIHFHIFTEDQLYPSFMRELDRWPSYVRHRVSFRFNHVTYPESLLGWKNLHRPCSSFKLFLPHVLKDLDFAIYIDSDSTFLNSLDIMWSRLLHFKSSNVLSLAATPVTTRLSQHGITPLDARVVLFDNFRLRHAIFKVPVAVTETGVNGEVEFELANMTWHPNMLHTLHNLFGKDITVPDQDMLSILYHFNRDKIDLFPCSWAFRWKYCESYLSSVTSRFLNATLNWPLKKELKFCSNAFLVHSGESYMAGYKRSEFSLVQKIWNNASFDHSKVDVLQALDIVLKENAGVSSCFKLNLKLFRKGLKASATVT